MTARKAERITETTTKRVTKRVTERVTVEEPAPAAVQPSLPCVHRGDPTPTFAHLLVHYHHGARWAHPEFIAAEAARAATFRDSLDDAPVPVTAVQVVDVPRVPYPELYEATHEFTDADQDQLAWKLSEVGY